MIDFNFEKQNVVSTEKQGLKEKPLSEAEKEVYGKYVPIFIQQEPRLDDFLDQYSEKEIKEDKNLIDGLERKFIKKTSRALILEAILAQQIEQANWLGDDCFVVCTSKYDDYVNHTDIVVEFRHNKEPIRLAIDVTTNKNREQLTKKIEYIEKDIYNDKLTSLKYYLFDEMEPSYKGKLELVPRVVIGTDNDGVERLCEIVKKTIGREKGSKEKLANYYLQIEFLEEIKRQLEYFIEYAKIKKDHSEKDLVVSQQQKVLKIINNVLENKTRLIGLQPNQTRRNQVYNFLTSLSIG